MGEKLGWWKSTAFVVGCGCLIALVTYGLRTSFGLFAAPIGEGRGWSPEVFALAIAIQNIVWGMGQPFAGAVADRYGAARILAAGGVVYAAGVALMAVSPTPLAFNLSAGVLVGLGLSGASFTIVIAALGRLVPEDRSSQAMGLATAAGSLGQFVFAPLGQAFLTKYGWQTALLLLAGSMVVVPVLAVALKGGGAGQRGTEGPELPAREAVRRAFGHGSYLLLVAGFFVCGFHVAFITTHLPAHIAAVAGHSHAGMDTAGPAVAAWALALIGLFNIVGSYGSGVLGARHSKRQLLAGDLPLQGHRHRALHHPASDLGGGARLRGGDGSSVALDGAPDLGARRRDVRHGEPRDPFRARVLQPPDGGFSRGLARRGGHGADWLLHAGVVAGIALAIIAAGLHWPIVERPAPSFATPAQTEG